MDEYSRVEYKGYAGRKRGGDRVWIEIRVETSDRPTTTIDHETVAAEYTTVAMSVVGKSAGRRIVDSAGQAHDIFDAIDTPARGWTLDELRRLGELWQRWHLNGMRAACAHQTVIGEGGADSLDETAPCPETGYKWGSAWLLEPIPADILAEIHAFGRRLDDSWPTYN